MKPKIRIGISGWRYPPWRKVFYPGKLAQRRELEFASRALPSIEINGSFYALQRPSSYQQWYEQTPPGFVFSLKANRYITHLLRLRDIERPLANFFASGLLALKEKLGPILWQFPPNFRFDASAFEHFLSLLPHDTQTAAKLAKQHDPYLNERAYFEVDEKRVLHHAVEIRNASFETNEFIRMLRQYNVALVIADTAGKWPYKEDITADFVYIRLHGAEELYASGYTDQALNRWAARIRAWSEGGQPKNAHLITALVPPARKSRDIYCYFDNDIKVKAPFDARKLLRKLNLEAGLVELDWSHADERGELNPVKALGKKVIAKGNGASSKRDSQ